MRDSSAAVGSCAPSLALREKCVCAKVLSWGGQLTLHACAQTTMYCRPGTQTLSRCWPAATLGIHPLPAGQPLPSPSAVAGWERPPLAASLAGKHATLPCCTYNVRPPQPCPCPSLAGKRVAVAPSPAGKHLCLYVVWLRARHSRFQPSLAGYRASPPGRHWLAGPSPVTACIPKRHRPPWTSGRGSWLCLI